MAVTFLRSGARVLIAALSIHMATTEANAQSPARPRPKALNARATRVAEKDIVYEASVTELQEAMTEKRITAVQLVNAYLARIAAYDQAGPKLNAIIRLNPTARADAARLDAERLAGKVRGPLHGIPILLKDNYSTTDMITSDGSIAFASLHTPFDAFQVTKLREAGAVILGKTNMHELASGITTISSVGGQTCNPYDPDRIPGGSSGGSGAAVAASFAALAWGSDTCGSIRIPSAVQNLFGLRPTKGLSSVSGIVPLSHSQDVGGPIARSVRDLAIALDATVGRDPNDAATNILEGKTLPHFVSALDAKALTGKRIGVLTMLFGNESDDQEGNAIVRAAIEKMKTRGVEFVDVDIAGLEDAIGKAGVIPFELKFDLQDFLAKIPDAPVHSLTELLQLGLYHTQLDATLHLRDAPTTRESAEYSAALAQRKVARDLVTAFLDANKLDALVYPALRRKAALIGEPQRGNTCQLSAVTGLPAISMPAGFTPDGLPIGLELLARPLDDARLVAMAYDYEQAIHPRVAPTTVPPLVNGHAPRAVAFATSANAKGVLLKGTFVFDAPSRSLEYAVSVTGVPTSDVYGINIVRDSAGARGPVMRRLVAGSTTSSRGTVKLGYIERRDLVAGNLKLVVYTRANPTGDVRAPMVLSAR
jgi:amidase